MVTKEFIMNEIKEITNRLKKAAASFNLACEDELIEAAIYEEMSLKSRYAYLLRLAKEHNIKKI